MGWKSSLKFPKQFPFTFSSIAVKDVIGSFPKYKLQIRCKEASKGVFILSHRKISCNFTSYLSVSVATEVDYNQTLVQSSEQKFQVRGK